TANENKTTDGFTTRHAYTITNFVADNRGGGQVSIRNPHAGADNSPDGNITIPVDKFVKNFSRYTIARKAVTPIVPKISNSF
ncbi:MAG: hypothetical protein K2X81_06170, partial [Candidatus Obscuribacterales bacterium]|nr:hypothetical protein [Candidatus Obscuribacterales bacterium]